MKAFVFLPLLFTLNLYSQQPAASAPEKPPLPPAPIIKPLGNFAQWTVTYRSQNNPGENKKAEKAEKTETDEKPALKSITITKSGPNTYCISEIAANGKRSDRWIVDGSEVVISQGKPMVMTGSRGVDFSDFSWISPENYKSVAKVQGVNCYVFQDKLPVADGVISSSKVIEGTEIPVMNVVAAISMDAQLPVYLNLGQEMRFYKFANFSGPALTVPPDILSVLNQRNKRLEVLTRRPQ